MKNHDNEILFVKFQIHILFMTCNLNEERAANSYESKVRCRDFACAFGVESAQQRFDAHAVQPAASHAIAPESSVELLELLIVTKPNIKHQAPSTKEYSKSNNIMHVHSRQLNSDHVESYHIVDEPRSVRVDGGKHGGQLFLARLDSHGAQRVAQRRATDGAVAVRVELKQKQLTSGADQEET